MTSPVINIENIEKSFKELKAVDGVSFSVDKGSCFGLLGPNGAGKTTIVKMLYGMVKRDPGQGKIDILGLDPRQDELEIKFISGIVPQEDNLDIELTVSENLFIYAKFYNIPKKTASGRIDELLQFIELNEKRKSLIRELSGGMKRRLTIVRALLNNPQILFLDEPTTGLDPQVRHLIWDKIRILKKNGVTILLTTHYMEEAFQICDRLMIMDRGRKVLEGKPAQLIADNIEAYVLEIYSREYDSQMVAYKEKQQIRFEETDNRLLLYCDDLRLLEEICINKCKAGEFYLRQSNLEDLFLKTTGRNLNE